MGDAERYGGPSLSNGNVMTVEDLPPNASINPKAQKRPEDCLCWFLHVGQEDTR